MSIFTQEQELQRIEKVNELRKNGINPYINDIKKTLSNKEFKDKYSYVSTRESRRDEDANEVLIGRVKLYREAGKKAAFIDIEDSSDKIQVYMNKGVLGEEKLSFASKMVDIGDFIEITGYPFVTQKGEFSIYATDIRIVTKALTPLPEKFHGLSNMETRYRQRYLDLISNKDVRDIFYTRSKVVSLIRRFFEDRGFIEAETPILNPIPGGANARPFITHHNALGVDRYLRIATELYLKRLIVGGFDGVFEIGRIFRNEGIDHTHNPEFTSIEWYWAYKTYEDLIEQTKELLLYILHSLKLPRKIPFKDYEIDFDNFQTVSWRDSLVEIGGLNRDYLDNKEEIVKILLSKGIDADTTMTIVQLQEEYFDEFVESKLINPTFITEIPIEISPLARRNDVEKEKADRFELYIAGSEVANAFSELNDPLDQYDRFLKQVENKDAGDEESMFMDEDFVKALGYGMPPTAGEGLGIDRLVMILTNTDSIKEVILFPAMR